MALMPGVKQYLKQLCSSGDGALTLHRALDKQLDELTAASQAKKAAVLDGFMAALDKVAGLCNMTRRDRQNHLCAPRDLLCVPFPVQGF